MRELMVLVLVAVMATWGIGNAQDNADQKLNPSPVNPEKKPDAPDVQQKPSLIEIRQVGTDKKPAQEYYYEGKQLKSYQDFKTILTPLNDTEANRLLGASSSQETLGVVVIVGGCLLVGSGILYGLTATGSTQTHTTTLPFEGPPGSTGSGLTFSNTTTTPADTTLAWVLGGAGLALDLLGFTIVDGAEQNRKNAVTRYNHLIDSDPGFSMILLPHSDIPVLQMTQRF